MLDIQRYPQLVYVLIVVGLFFVGVGLYNLAYVVPARIIGRDGMGKVQTLELNITCYRGNTNRNCQRVSVLYKDFNGSEHVVSEMNGLMTPTISQIGQDVPIRYANILPALGYIKEYESKNWSRGLMSLVCGSLVVGVAGRYLRSSIQK